MKEEMTIDEMFQGIPEFVRIFKSYDRDLRRYSFYNWNEHTTKERLERKRDEFLDIAKKLNHSDLLILYYVRHIESLDKSALLRMLRKLYRAQCAFKNEFYKTGEYVDIFEIGHKVQKNKDK